VEALKQVINVYKGKGHSVQSMNFTEDNQPIHTILGDNEFEAIKEDMLELGVEVNVTAKKEHVPEIERQHRVIKEKARAVIQTLPFRNMPRKMRIALIQNVVFWLNNIPKTGQDHSPKDLICGEQRLNYKTNCRLPFGAYAQVHNDQSITNTMISRTTGAISLGSVGNMQGTYHFMSLRTGDIIVRRTWTELPMPAEVIDRVMELTTNEGEYEDDLDELEAEPNDDDPREINEDEVPNDEVNHTQETNSVVQGEQQQSGQDKQMNEQDETRIEDDLQHKEANETAEEDEESRQKHEHNLRPN